MSVPNAPAPSPALADAKQLASSTSFTLFGRLAGRGAQVVAMILLARAIGPSLFGVYAMAWAITRVVAYLATGGAELAAIRFGAAVWQERPQVHKAILVRCGLLVCVISVFVAVALYICAPLVSSLFGSAEVSMVLRVFSPGLPAMAVLILVGQSMRVGTNGWHATLAEDVIQPILSLVALLVFFGVGLTLLNATLIILSSFLIAAFISLYFIRRAYPLAFASAAEAGPSFGALLSFSIPASLPSRLSLLLLWVDRLLLGRFLPSAQVGIYQAASQFSLGVQMVLGAVTSAIGPMIAHCHHCGDTARLHRVFALSTRWGLYLCMSFLLVLLILPREVMSAVYGERYVGGAALLFILTIGQLVNAATGAVSAVLVMADRVKRWLVLSAAMLVVDIVLIVQFTPTFGPAGAALATSLSLIGIKLVGLAMTAQVTGHWPFDLGSLRVLLASALAGAGLLLLRHFALWRPLITVCVALFVSFGVFVGVLAMLGFDAQEKALFSEIREWRRRRG